MQNIDKIEQYLKDDTRRLIELDDLYIKRVYTEQGIVFECGTGDTVTECRTADQVKQWAKTTHNRKGDIQNEDRN